MLTIPALARPAGRIVGVVAGVLLLGGAVWGSGGFESDLGDVVSATVLFESRAGTDLPKTLRFAVNDGVITAIE